MNRTRCSWPVLAGWLALAVAGGCGRGKSEAPAEGRAAAAESEPALDGRLVAGKLAELGFVPLDAEAVVRVDLADVAARSPQPAESLRAFDFLLRAQQPAAWQMLSSAGIVVGRDVTTLYLVLGARPAATGAATKKKEPDPFLIAGLGSFDAVAVKRLAEAITKTGAAVETSFGATLFVWKRPSGGAVGASVPPGDVARFGDAAIGVMPGLLVFGAPPLVRRALEARAGKARDVRHGALARELLAVDSAATVWGAASPAAGAASAYLPTVIPGLVSGHFSTALAAPGRDLDGLFLLRAEFASPAQAAAFRDDLTQLLAYADLLGGRTPLGATISQVRKNAKLSVEGQTVVAAASL